MRTEYEKCLHAGRSGISFEVKKEIWNKGFHNKR